MFPAIACIGWFWCNSTCLHCNQLQVLEAGCKILFMQFLCAGGKARECCRLVPLAPWLWLLAFRNWCVNSDAESDLSGAIFSCGHWPYTNCISWKSWDWCISYISPRLQATWWASIRISNYSTQQNWGFWRSLQTSMSYFKMAISYPPWFLKVAHVLVTRAWLE